MKVVMSEAMLSQDVRASSRVHANNREVNLGAASPERYGLPAFGRLAWRHGTLSGSGPTQFKQLSPF
jgi:hypothetical protein